MFNFLRKTKKQKIFCISIQRTGTTSVGDFFEKHNYRRAGWYHSKENNWGKLYFDGNYEAIFSSMDFKNNDVFEDGPESIGHFYKYLFHRFPNSIFILLNLWVQVACHYPNQSHFDDGFLFIFHVFCQMFSKLIIFCLSTLSFAETVERRCTCEWNSFIYVGWSYVILDLSLVTHVLFNWIFLVCFSFFLF